MADARLLPRLVGAALLVGAGAAALWRPAGGGDAAIALPLVIATIAFWAGGFLPEYLTAFAFFTLMLVLKLAPAEVVLSGFTSSSLWLVLGGLILGLAMEQTGLGRRLAGLLKGLGLEGASYARVCAAVVGLGVLAIFIMPSATGRIVLVMGIVAPLAVHLGFQPGSRGHAGLVLAGAFGTFLPAFAVLPANVPNMVLNGSMERLTGHGFTFADYFIRHFPVLGLGRAVMVWAVICLFYRDQPAAPTTDDADQSAPLGRGEIRLAVVLAVLVALWVSDAWHHVSPAWVALAGATACLLPPLGILRADAIRQINMATFIHIGAVIGLGAVVGRLDLGGWAADVVLDWFPMTGHAGIGDFSALVLLSSLLGVVTTAPGVPAVLTPMSGHLAARSGFSVDDVGMMQMLGISTIWLPHQTPPLMAAIPLSGVPAAQFLRLCLVFAALASVLLLPLDAVWWMILGHL